MKARWWTWFLCAVLTVSGVAVAQTPSAGDRARPLGVDGDTQIVSSQSQFVPTPQWGTSGTSALRLPAAAFTPRLGIAAWGSNGQGQRWRISQTVGTGTVTSDQFFDAPIILPTGALLTGVRFDYCDTNATVDVAGAVQSAPEPAGGVDQYGAFGSSGTPGCTSSLVDLSSAPPQINNSTASFWARFSLGAATDSSTQLRGATVFYKLQVSPAPAVATFTDVPTSHPFFQYIEALASSGITGGCVASPPQYCPDAPVTRGQMAVFISRALGLHWPN